jgi:S1-C subfamily serine protease
VAGREPLARAWDGVTGRSGAAQVSAFRPRRRRRRRLAASAGRRPARVAGRGTIIRVAQQVSPAVVLVERQGSSGSGVIARRDGVVLTNAHVVGTRSRCS